MIEDGAMKAVKRNTSVAIVYFLPDERVERNVEQDSFGEWLLAPLAFKRRT